MYAFRGSYAHYSLRYGDISSEATIPTRERTEINMLNSSRLGRQVERVQLISLYTLIKLPFSSCLLVDRRTKLIY
jgi:hypothetical protein